MANELVKSVLPKTKPGTGVSVDLVVVGFGLWAMSMTTTPLQRFTTGVRKVIEVTVESLN